MTKHLIFILTVISILLCMGAVNATQVTMDVDSKHIIGMGNGNDPFNYDKFINVVYVISERQDCATDRYIIQEYPVSIQDYCKIQIGQKVTLDVPDSRTEVCKVVKIE